MKSTYCDTLSSVIISLQIVLRCSTFKIRISLHLTQIIIILFAYYFMLCSAFIKLTPNPNILLVFVLYCYRFSQLDYKYINLNNFPYCFQSSLMTLRQTHIRFKTHPTFFSSSSSFTFESSTFDSKPVIAFCLHFVVL